MTQRQTKSSLEYTRNGNVSNSTSSLSTGRSNIANPTSLEFSFILHSVKGAHFSKQSVCISVNGHSFVFNPRYKKNQQRFYGNGFLIYVPADEIIRFSVGIVTPEDDNKKNNKKTGFLHNFIRYSFVPPSYPILQELTMETVGSTYTINATIGVTPSIKCTTPVFSQNPQEAPKKRSVSPLRKTVPSRARGPSYMHHIRPQTQVGAKRFPIRLNRPSDENKNATNDNENSDHQERPASKDEHKGVESNQPTPFVTDVNTAE